jgi:hypothetical protein
LSVGQPADRHKEQVFHFPRNGFDDYFVVQRAGIDPATAREFPSVDEEIGDGFTLQTAAVRKSPPVYWIRLSRVTAADEARMRAWRERDPRSLTRRQP